MNQRTVEGSVSVAQAVLASCCVFAGGAGVMIYEFLAIRILQRFFGGAMDVWASEIAVCLGGLALGYGLGGFLADRFPSWANVGVSLLVAGATACFTEPVAVWAGEGLIDQDWGRYWHPLLAAGACSFVPMLALGTIMPQAVRLTARDLDRLGASTGLLFALSTVGSIVGVLAISPLLLRWSVLQVLYGASALLVATGMALILAGQRRRNAGLVAPLLLTMLLLATSPAGAEILYERYSAHHHIVVEDVKNTRMLRFDNAVQSLMSLKEPRNGGFGYTDYFHVPFVFNPGIGRALFLGLGGGTGPKAFLKHYPKVTVDVAEIDPQVEKVARQFFELPEDPRLAVHIDDGRVYLQRSKESYGVIVVDAYASGARGAYLPYHLATREFFQLVRKRLDHGGCVVYNAIGYHDGMNHDVISGLLATMRDSFESVYVFEETTSINTLFVAVKLDKPTGSATPPEGSAAWPEGPYLDQPVSADTLGRLTRQRIEAGASHLEAMEKKFRIFAPVQYSNSDAQVLTDNRAPVDISGRRQ